MGDVPVVMSNVGQNMRFRAAIHRQRTVTGILAHRLVEIARRMSTPPLISSGTACAAARRQAASMVGITALPASTTTSTCGSAGSVARSSCASQAPTWLAAASVAADSGGNCSAILSP